MPYFYWRHNGIPFYGTCQYSKEDSAYYGRLIGLRNDDLVLYDGGNNIELFENFKQAIYHYYKPDVLPSILPFETFNLAREYDLVIEFYPMYQSTNHPYPLENDTVFLVRTAAHYIDNGVYKEYKKENIVYCICQDYTTATLFARTAIQDITGKRCD